MSGSVAYVRPVFEQLAPAPGSLVERILLKVRIPSHHSWILCPLHASILVDVLYLKHSLNSAAGSGQHFDAVFRADSSC